MVCYLRRTTKSMSMPHMSMRLTISLVVHTAGNDIGIAHASECQQQAVQHYCDPCGVLPHMRLASLYPGRGSLDVGATTRRA